MGRLRIIAGELRGRRIQVADERQLRPTPDRVREALFSILHEDLIGATVLDAYAGTGALGFEALSRGAGHVVFIESSAGIARALEQTREELGILERTRVIVGEVRTLVERGGLGGPFDLVLADPPYGSQELEPFLAAVGNHGLVRPGGCLVVEREVTKNPENTPTIVGLVQRRSREYGRVALDFYDRPLVG